MSKMFGYFTGAEEGAFGRIEAAAASDGQPKKQPTVSGTAYSGGYLRVNWPLPVVVDLTGLRATQRVAILLDHTRSQLVGQGEASIGAQSVKLSGVLTGDCETPGEPAHKVCLHAKGGFEWPLSIGVDPQKVEEVAAGATVKVNGRNFTGPCYVVRAGVLQEVSFVSIGGDEKASAKVAASAAGENNMPTFKEWLAAQGKDIAVLAEAEQTKLQAAYDALKDAGLLQAGAVDPVNPQPKPKVVADDPMAQLRAAAAAEHKRQAMIVKHCGTKYPELAAQATEEGWDEPRLTAEVKILDLQASRPKAPAVHVHDAPQLTAEVCEASLCATGRLPNVEQAFSEKTLEASQKLGRLGLQEIIMLVAQAGGWSGRMTASNFRAEHKRILQAAFGTSSIDITGILSNTANKFLLSSFNTVEGIWRRISAVVPATDFKTMTRYRMMPGGQYRKVGADGEIKHGTLSEESRTNKVETYGEMLVVTRQDQYNDDMRAITQVPAQLGGDAARALNTVFWDEFENNASFFSSGNANLVAGSGRPFYLVVDPAKGGSDMAVMEVAFLDGRDTPVVETAEADFNTLGIQMRSYHDWGCAKAEHRGGVKSLKALSLDSLEAANKLFLDQTIDGTHPLGVMPHILLTATGDAVLAKQLYVSSEVRNTTAGTKSLTANAFQGSFEPLVSSYLANS